MIPLQSSCALFSHYETSQFLAPVNQATMPKEHEGQSRDKIQYSLLSSVPLSKHTAVPTTSFSKQQLQNEVCHDYDVELKTNESKTSQASFGIATGCSFI